MQISLSKMQCTMCTSPPPRPGIPRDKIDKWLKRWKEKESFCDKHFVSSCLQEIIGVEAFKSVEMEIRENILILYSYLVMSAEDIDDHDEAIKDENSNNNVCMSEDALVDEKDSIFIPKIVMKTEDENSNASDSSNYEDDESDDEFKARKEKTNQELFPCDFCGIEYKYKTSLTKHILKKHSGQDDIKPEKKFKCDECDLSWNNPRSIRLHNVSVHGYQAKSRPKRKYTEEDLIYQCKLCERKFAIFDTYRCHMNRNHKVWIRSQEDRDPRSDKGGSREKFRKYTLKKWKCEECDMYFQKESLLRRHMFEKHEQNLCDQCGSKFEDYEFFLIHQKTHGGLVDIRCDICNEVFDTEVGLKMHKNTKHVDKSLLKICPECGISCLRLEKHMKNMHENVAKCSECDFKAGEIGLKKHYEKVHMKAVRKECPHCHKQVKLLSKHIKIYHESRCIQCQFCDFKTKYENNLKAHVRRLHENKPLTEPCPNCGKEVGSLDNHIRRCPSLQSITL